MISSSENHGTGSCVSNGYVAWKGKSAFNGEKIVLIVLVSESRNRKTGNMAQSYILRDGRIKPSQVIVRQMDASICGNCSMRYQDDGSRMCYVPLHNGMTKVWTHYKLHRYPYMCPKNIGQLLARRALRIGAYGDPAMVPFEVWDDLLQHTDNYTGYTHQWRWCDERFQRICMASVETLEDALEAQRRGWRTFRVISEVPALYNNEILCPASEEAGKKVTCRQCQLCQGMHKVAKNIGIVVHGTHKKKHQRRMLENERALET